MLWYLILNKRQLLLKLFKIDLHVESKKIYKFLLKDFTNPKNLKAAKKNAYKLYSLKKFYLCACFFFIAELYDDCVNIVLNKLDDI